MTTVRDGIYLEDHPPVRSQFRVGRRDPIRPVIVVHTAESGTDLSGPDPKAENVARFIQRRTTAGSYHLIGDADSVIQLVRFENEAYGDITGSNRWAIHISLAMNAADWHKLPPQRRDDLVRSAAAMARMAAAWLERHGLGRPEPVLLTKAQSDRSDASGFISHARRDPNRRTDPGPGFPWPQFFAAYQGDTMATIEVPDEHVTKIQNVVAEMGFDPGPIDGIPGPRTLTAVEAMADELVDWRTNSSADDARDAGLWRKYAAARATIANLDEIATRANAS